jgi:hypothetical protein
MSRWILTGSAIALATVFVATLPGHGPAADKPASLTDAHHRALLALKQQGSAIVSCQLHAIHFQFAPGDMPDARPGEEIRGGIDVSPSEMFGALRSDKARVDPEALLEAARGLFAKKGAALDLLSGKRIYFAMEGAKIRWDYLDGDRIQARAAFDGSQSVLDSEIINNQTTVRSGDSFASAKLRTYRFIPDELANIQNKLSATPDLPFPLALQYENAEYGLGNGPLTEYVAVRDDQKRVRTQYFQFYFREDWKPVALPSIRIDCDYDEDGRLATFDMYRMLDARVNQSVPADVFQVPLKAGRLFVDERKSPVVPIKVTRDYPDALEFAASSEADKIHKILVDPSDVDRLTGTSGNMALRWPWHRVMLLATGVLLITVTVIMVWVRRRNRSSASNL